jgi:outer membrane protein insertion porin family
MGLILRIWMIVALLLSVVVATAQGTGAIKDVVIQGNQQVSREAILAAMRTKVGQPYIQSNLDADKESINSLGFFSAVDVHAEAMEGDWRVVVNVSEFPLIKEIRVIGNKAVTTEEILKVVTLKPGDIYSLKERNPSVAAIEVLYVKKGFFARVGDFSPLQESPNTLNISITEMTVNSVKVEQNERTKDSVVMKLVKTRPGEPLNTTKWRNDLRRLWSTGWFESVENIDQPQTELGKVDLVARVKETKTGTFNVGLQVDPRSTFAGFIKVEDPNFRGTGQNIGVNLMQSTQGGGTSIDLNYANPFMDSRETSMSASLYSRILYRFTGGNFGGSSSPTRDNQFFERHTGFALGFGRPLREGLNVSVSGRVEKVETSDIQSTNNLDFIKQDGEVASLTFGITSNTRDVDLDPASGYWAHAEVTPGFANITDAGGAVGTSLLGRSSYVKSFLEYRGYYSDQPERALNINDPRRVLALRVRYGNILGGRAPFFEQFFAGGSDTLRGYDEDRFWGKEMMLATAEYRYPLQKSMNLIGFVDYGDAWGGYNSVGKFIQDKKFTGHVGYGLGLSFKTPLGPIRLDLGFNEEGRSRTHFLIGTSF